MNEAEEFAAKHEIDEELFLVELSGGDRATYAICQRLLIVDPDSSRDLPWSELAALFQGKTLRAVPMRGKAADGLRSRHLEGGASTLAGASSRAGVTTAVEVNLIKIERKD